jgi:hypothetical protein
MRDIWILVLTKVLCTVLIAYGVGSLRMAVTNIQLVQPQSEPAPMTTEGSAKAILLCRKHHMGHTEPLNKRGEVIGVQCTGWPSSQIWDNP